jgi:carotenoid 1,2-hydratase
MPERLSPDTPGTAAPPDSSMGPPAFDGSVAPGGYQWWYLDALDADNQRGIVVIAFVGSVFSPYYFSARRNGRADPQNYCAINVALYHRRGKAWCMTERRAGSVSRGPSHFRIGPSLLRWENGELIIEFHERRAPFGQRLSGRVRATPQLHSTLDLALDGAGSHRWAPWAPLARVTVELTEPAVSWRGQGYMDANRGDEPLERAFSGWNWCRIGHPKATDVRYGLAARDGSHRSLALRFDSDGHRMMDSGVGFDLRRSGWGVPRQVQWDSPPELSRTLEDTPFYARSLLAVQGAAGLAHGVHEALCLDRFRRAWVRSLLPFRMPREWRASRR